MRKKRNYIYLGETGSGKSELAVNHAVCLAREAMGRKEVHFFDLDQTKPLFRSRDVNSQLRQAGVKVYWGESFRDVPAMPGGVVWSLQDEKSSTILDIGGDMAGARMIGGFSKWLDRDSTEGFLVMNPYRPWSQTQEAALQLKNLILSIARLENVKIISNPNLGEETNEEDVLLGHRKVKDFVGTIPVSCLCVKRELYKSIQNKTDTPVIPIDLYMKYENLMMAWT